MDVCCVCHNSSDWFHESVSLLQSNHSERSICAVLKMIMGEELASDWSAADTMCHECVDKINDYDEAFEKMRLIEGQLRLSHLNINIKLENEENSVFDVTTMSDDGGMYVDDGVDDEVDDCTSDTYNDPFDESPFALEIDGAEDTSEFNGNLSSANGLKIHGLRIHMVSRSRRVNCNICNTSFPNKSDLEAHKRSATCRQPTFSCLVCDEFFSQARYLKEHMTRHNRTMGLEPPFECDYCDIDFDDHGELKEHKMYHLVRSNFQCTQCEYTGKAPKYLKQHMRTHTKSNKCDICCKGFISATSLETHLKNHENDVIAECYICKHRTASTAKLREHMRIEHTHERSQIQCTKCGEQFASDNDRIAHTSACTLIAPRSNKKAKYECNQCGKIFLSGGALGVHMKNAHKTDKTPPFGCILCGMDLSDAEALAEHKKRHESCPEFTCVECGRLLSSGKTLKQHMALHTGIRPYECNKCGKRFAVISVLNTHMKTHVHATKQSQPITMTPPFECKYCGIELDDYDEFKEHRREHSIRPEYQCLECEYIGKSPKLLKQHMQKHTRRNKCDICGKGFVSSTLLQSHFRKHENDDEVDQKRPFECSRCDERFANDDDLNAHACANVRRLRNQKEKFECDQCGRCFLRSVALVIHRKYAHNIDTAEPFECTRCGMDLGDAKALAEHSKRHENLPDFACAECERVLASKKSLKQHMPIHTDKRPFECTKCDKRFAFISFLNAHMKTHTPDTECDYCGVNFDDDETMKEHRKLHVKRPKIPNNIVLAGGFQVLDNQERLPNLPMGPVRAEFECRICQENFPSLGRLKEHITKHNLSTATTPPFECEYCGIEYDDHDEFKEHKRLHLTRPNCQCLECEYIGKMPKLLKQHMRKHTRHNKCGICGKGFVSSTSLHTHLKKHGDKDEVKTLSHDCRSAKSPFQCMKCDEKFANHGDLNTHTCANVSQKEKFECDQCGKYFRSNSALVVHRKFKHKIDSTLPFECTICGMHLGDAIALAKHSERHENLPDLACIECKRLLASKRSLQQHMRIHSGEKPYECTYDQCGKRFKLSAGFRTHTETAHETDHQNHKIVPSLSFECSLCGMHSADAIALAEHSKRHESLPDFTCFECKRVLTSKDGLKKHMRIHSGEKPYKCAYDQCGKRFTQSSSLRSHTETIHKMGIKNEPRECNYCGMEFEDEVSFNKHKEQHFKKKDFNCTECECVFPTRSSLKTHMLNHFGEKLYECSECGMRFGLESNRNIHFCMHLMKKDVKSRFDCEYCRESFLTSTLLLRHSIKLHKERGNFRCSICPSKFPNKFLLEEHMARATCEPAAFICQICQKGFIFERNLKSHTQSHDRLARKQLEVKCEYCGIYLRNSEMLSEHKIQHQNLPEFQCLQCEFIGKTTNQLKVHTHIHTKVWRFQCEQCGKRFHDSSSFRTHRKYHNKDLNVECYMCKLRTLTVGHMQVHMRRHTGVKPYPCDICGKRFARQCNRDSHSRIHFR